MNAFDEIRPYNDSEVPVALHRIMESRLFPIFVRYVLHEDENRMRTLFQGVSTVEDFQVKVMKPLLEDLMRSTTSGFTANGLVGINRQKRYLYISNHRDIVLDAAWLDVAMKQVGLPLMEITFGSNLMSSQFNIDLGKVNKMFRLSRGGNKLEFYKCMNEVSHYMRYVLTVKRESVWIAQRNGRTKNGDDHTEVALLKMLAMSGKGSLVDNLGELNICPVSVSYEYEPCDFLKTAEVYLSQRQPYVKSRNEDMHSIRHGIRQWKGDVHFEVAKPIEVAELEACVAGRNDNDAFKALAELIDKRVYEGYHLHPTNYIAYDMLNATSQFATHYSTEEYAHFETYMLRGLSQLAINADFNQLRTIFLKIYANPVSNALRVGALRVGNTIN